MALFARLSFDHLVGFRLLAADIFFLFFLFALALAFASCLPALAFCAIRFLRAPLCVHPALFSGACTLRGFLLRFAACSACYALCAALCS